MIGPLATRVVILVFGAIQTLLTIRLVLPFIALPSGLAEWIPTLINVTDMLIAPFKGFTNLFGIDLGGVAGGPFGGTLPGQMDASVIVALIGWSILELIIITVLRVFVRPEG